MEKKNGTLQNVEGGDIKLLTDNPKKFWKDITSIGHMAFSYRIFREIKLPKNLTSIGVKAFYRCENLREVNLPDSITTIGDEAFYGCRALEKIKLPQNLTSISDNTFDACCTLKEVILPKSLKNIGAHAFYTCNNLTEITLPEGVTNIGEGAFAFCTQLTKIILPQNLTSLAGLVFAGCSRLKEVELPNDITDIGYNAFSGCANLLEISLPEGLVEIGKNAFYNCQSLTKMILPDSVTSIGKSAFAHCVELKEIRLPNNITNIEETLFSTCISLTEIILPEGVTKIGPYAFGWCESLTKITVPKTATNIDETAFDRCDLKYIYLSKDGDFTLSRNKIDELEKTCISEEFFMDSIFTPSEADKIIDGKRTLSLWLNNNFRKNYAKLKFWQKENKIKFIPPDHILETFPASQIEKFFLNNNHQRWGKLVKTLGFDALKGTEKTNSLVDLMKIYYVIGGFSDNQGESEAAFDYILRYVAKSDAIDVTSNEIGAKIHSEFSKLKLKGEYNKSFAQFFMKYYKDNPLFMSFKLRDVSGELMESQNYLCQAANNFDVIQKNFPYRVVNGNNERDLLTPLFVAEHCIFVEYEYVDEGNEVLAQLVGRYGYGQEEFDHIQAIYEKAKKLKDSCTIRADKANENALVQFRILEKDDPLGFVLGDITDCCQHIGGAGEKCVEDAYTNPDAGFMVFEGNAVDENGELANEKRVLGQAYIWYDPETKTVCYDNIEIPEKVLKEMRRGDNFTSKNLIEAVEESAIAIMTAMNKNGISVEQVTTGEGYNKLKNELSKHFKRETDPKAQHRDYCGYSDAREAQYIIKTYNEVLNMNYSQEPNLTIKKTRHTANVEAMR